MQTLSPTLLAPHIAATCRGGIQNSEKPQAGRKQCNHRVPFCSLQDSTFVPCLASLTAAKSKLAGMGTPAVATASWMCAGGAMKGAETSGDGGRGG